MKKQLKNQFRAAAKRLYHDEGTIEVDDTARISTSDPEEGCATPSCARWPRWRCRREK